MIVTRTTRDETIHAFDLLWTGVVVLQLMDIVWTNAAIRLGNAREGNPAMQLVVHSVWLSIAVKMVMVTFGWLTMRAGVVESRGTAYGKFCWAGSFLVLISYVTIVGHNTTLLVH